MNRTLNQISRSPFTRRIKGGKLPWRFTQPTFTMYNGRTDPVEHISHFNQRMVVHSKNEALMCKVFLSSLGPVVMRWFDGLGAGSIDSFKELTQVFGSCFITCSRVLRPLDSLLSLSIRERKTLKTYSDRYWRCSIRQMVTLMTQPLGLSRSYSFYLNLLFIIKGLDFAILLIH